ncbi:MAG: hypothetical protein Tsb0014_04610 [Pleurocapsa sp.]
MNDFSLNFSDSSKKTITAIVVLFLFCGVIGIYKFIAQVPSQVTSWMFPQSQSVAEIQNVIIGGLQEMDVLTTAQISNRATIKVTDNRMLSRFQIGQTNLIYEGVGNVEAGINIEEISIEENTKDHKIYINLPSAYLKNVYLDIKKSGIVDTYKKGLGANVEQELQDQAQRQALTAIKAEACASNIIDQANKHAKELVENWTNQYDNIVVEMADSSNINCSLKI